MEGFKITNIDFSVGTWEQRFEITHDASSPMCLWLRVIDKEIEDGKDVNAVITLHSSEMKALGKALVFAAEYVEGLYNE
jgi:hypothetical protein